MLALLSMSCTSRILWTAVSMLARRRRNSLHWTDPAGLCRIPISPSVFCVSCLIVYNIPTLLPLFDRRRIVAPPPRPRAAIAPDPSRRAWMGRPRALST